MVAIYGVVSSSVWGWPILHPRASLCVGIWLFIGCLSVVILAGGPELMRRLSLLSDRVVSVGRIRLSGAEIVGAVAMTFLLVAGIGMQMAAGLENLRRVPEMDPNIEAAKWIRGHSAPGAVVMARWEPLVYHYSGHKVIWFPASSDPELLIAGIRRNHVRLIVVTEDQDDSYWRPSDSSCFQVLAYAYPMLFQQVHKGAHERVYELANEIQPTDGPSY